MTTIAVTREDHVLDRGGDSPDRKAIAASVILHLAVVCALFLLPHAIPPVEDVMIPVALVAADGAAGAAGGKAGGGGGGLMASTTESVERPQPAAPAEPVTASPILPEPPQVVPEAIGPAPVTLPVPPKPRPAPKRPPVAAAVKEATPPAPPVVVPEPLLAPAPVLSASAPAASAPGPQPGTATTGTAASGPGGATGSGLGNAGTGAGLAGSREGPGDDYFDRLRRHLAKYKRYPPEANRQKQEGQVHVEFTLARDGTVLAARIERGSGFPLLDQAVLDMLRTASPVPPLPDRFTAERISIAMPIDFSLGFFSRIF